MAPSLPDSGVDVYMGIGGSPEAVLAAAGIKCLGGDFAGDDVAAGQRGNARGSSQTGTARKLSKVYYADDLAHGKKTSCFCATGISDSALLPGVQFAARRGGGRIPC